MKSARWPLVLAYLSAGLFLILFLFITFLGGSRIGFLYSRVPGFGAFRSVLQWAGIVASLGFFVAGAIIAIPVAVERASWPHKVLAVLPALLLLFALGGIIATAAGIGTVGQMGFWPVLGPVTFATGWLALGAVLAVAAVVIAVAIGHISSRIQRAAGFVLGATSLAGVVAAVAMIGLLVLVANNQPSLPRFNRDNPQPEAALGATGGRQQGEQGAFQGQNQAGTPGAGGGEGNFGRNGGGRAFGPGEGEGEGGFGPGGGGPGGGGLAAIRQQFTTVGVLLVLAALVEVFSTLGVLAISRTAAGGLEAAAATSVAPGGGHGAGGAVLAGIGVILVAFGLIQLIPAQRTDPPVQSTVQWDAPQTQQLWQRACADCHSNQTQWPWYAAIAPGSWLIAGHVNAGRQSLNISELSNNAGFRRAPRAGESAQQVRSGAMPPADYLLIHPAARLTPAEKQQLIQGLQNTFGQ